MPLLLRLAACAIALFAASRAPALAQPSQRTSVEVRVVPDSPDWTYRVGEPARFEVSVLRSGHPIEGASVRYELAPDVMEPRASGPLELRGGRAVVEGGTMEEPGFLRLRVVAEVEGRSYEGAGTAGFSPDAIEPLATMPEDFAAYWEEAIRQARTVPLDPTMTRVADRSSEAVDVYHVSFQNDRAGSRIYGMLSVPTAPGRYPVILEVPGAGVRPYAPNVSAAERGVIHLAIGIHGLPVDLPAGVYADLYAGALSGYWTFGLQSRDTYYYRRVILGAVRAGDFLLSLPQADGQRYGVYGNSQGGALAIMTAALDERVAQLSAIHPALSDHEAFLHGRAGGWPRLLSAWYPQHQTPEIIENARYFDVVNFARQVRVPGFYTWGFNDTVCPPTSMHAAFNAIQAPKELWVLPETGHWTYPEQWDRVLSSLIDAFVDE